MTKLDFRTKMNTHYKTLRRRHKLFNIWHFQATTCITQEMIRVCYEAESCQCQNLLCYVNKLKS